MDPTALLRSALSAALCVAGAGSAARAQSFNIDVHDAFGTPSAAYGGAANSPGSWCSVVADQPLVAHALTDVTGAATGATASYTAGASFSLDNPATSGDAQALLDDCQDIGALSMWTFDGLLAGDYHVYVYSWAPDQPTLYFTNVSVLGGANGTQACGGAAWSGAHVQGETYVEDALQSGPNGSLSIQFGHAVGYASFNGLQLVYAPPHDVPLVYCTSGTSTNGCVPTLSATGNPSLTSPQACLLRTDSVAGQCNGMFLYGLVSDPVGLPLCSGGASRMCVKAPLQRTPNQPSGGTLGSCDGAFVLDWGAWEAAHPAALGRPWVLGEKLYVQCWYRDPLACKSSQLSEALELTYLP